MFIAIAPKGAEYYYKASSRLGVSKASAQRIADALTKANYFLKEGQVWHVYDDPYYDNHDHYYGTARVYKDRIKVNYDFGFCK